MIDSIRLTRFKKFKETRLELRPFTILTGGSNAGKTTVLQAIWLALHSLHEGRLLSVDRRTLQSKVSGTGCYLFDLPFVSREDLSGLFYNRISRNSSTYDENSGAMLELTDERGNELKLHVRELFKNINVKLLTPEEELRAPRLQARAPLYLQGGRGVKLQEERLFPAAIEARIAEDGGASSLRNRILDLKKQMPQKYRYLEQLMEKEFAFQICDMQFNESSERYLISEYKEKGMADAVQLEFGSCGSGLLNILQLLSAILRYCPEKSEVVLLDRPDAGLDGILSLKLMDTLRKIQEELGIQIILTTDSETVLRDSDPSEVLPVIAGAKVNRPLWTRSRSCGNSVDKASAEKQKSADPVNQTSVENQMDLTQTEEEKERQEAEAVSDKIDLYLDAYDLAQAKCSGKLALSSLGRRDIAILRRIGMAVHAPAFVGRAVVPVVQAKCGVFLNRVPEQENGNAPAGVQKDTISGESISVPEEEKQMQNDSQKEKDHDIGWTGCRRAALWERELGDLLGREIKVYAITQELRPTLEAAWESLKLRKNGAEGQRGSGYAGTLAAANLPEELRNLFDLLAPEEEQGTETKAPETEPQKTVRRDAYEQLSFPLE